MKGWTMPIQRASYRGVYFDVLSVDDSVDRALIEHAYPFVNGADIEDLGLNTFVVKLQAVFYGEGYFTDFKKCLEVLNKPGADTLVHPIRGRLPNMICYSASFKHEADNVDYVQLELSFKQATAIKPIFVAENSFLTKIDDLLNQLDKLVDEALALWGELMQYVALAYNVKSRLLSAWGALYGCFEQAKQLFDLDNGLFSLPTYIDKPSFVEKSKLGGKLFATLLEQGLTNISQQPTLTITSRFNDVLDTIDKVQAIPLNVVTGKNQQVKMAQGNVTKPLTSALKPKDVKEMNCLVHLLCSATLSKIGVTLIEHYGDQLLPTEIDNLVRQVRTNLVSTLNIIRELQMDIENSVRNVAEPNNALYSQTYKTADSIRQVAHLITELGIVAINKKPPLLVREAMISGTMGQIAHHFYGDYRRAEELLYLNPQINQPNFIERGTLLNSYAE